MILLGCIWRERGNATKALENYNNAVIADEENDVPHFFIANFHMSNNETRQAQTSFETVLKMKDQKDNPYALIGLGNVWLEALYSVKRGEKDEKEKITKFRDHAMHCFVKVLRQVWYLKIINNKNNQKII
jgi:RNA polymerase-associated protein CTR9